MIEKILGVVCLIAAGAFYTFGEPGENAYVNWLAVLGVVFLIAGYGPIIWRWFQMDKSKQTKDRSV